MNKLSSSITLFLVTIGFLIAIAPVFASADDQAHPHDTAEATSGHDHTDHSPGQDVLEPAHDHTSHAQGNEIGGVSRLGRWLGKFHPVVVHFPIALLIAAAVAELLKCLLGAEWLGGAARFSVLAGAVGGVVSALLGWLDAAFASYTGSLAWTLELHRWLGTTTAVWSVLTAVLCEVSVRSNSCRYRRWYLGTLAVGAILVGVTGHFGGTLIFGRGYYSW